MSHRQRARKRAQRVHHQLSQVKVRAASWHREYVDRHMPPQSRCRG